MSPRPRFPGLDSLRCFAALFVLVGHIPMNQGSAGLPNPAPAALFYRGETAVAFFFALSGFLITYLLLEEIRERGAVDVRAFYLRRVLRIWPLYFAVIAFGLVFYNLVLPRLGISYPVEYSLPLAVALYTFFLPNLMNALYTVGGILNPTWSIGVEEQFYLAWAPLVKRWHRSLPLVSAVVLLLSLANHYLALYDVFALREMTKFLLQLKFHFMAAGALAAWALHRHRARFLALPVFRWRVLQVALAFWILQFYLVDLWPMPVWLFEPAQLVAYTWLIVEVGANPRRLVALGPRLTEWLGTISYGIYMLHMIAVYATSFLFQRLDFWRGNLPLYLAGYYGLAVALTVLLSYLSHRFLESPFLRRKQSLAGKVEHTPGRA